MMQAISGRSIAVVIVNYRTPQLALQALAAVGDQRSEFQNLRAIMVDGGSGDHSAHILAEGLADRRFSGWATLLALDVNGGFGWANNQAILRLLQGSEPPDYIYLLNPDTRVNPGAIARLTETLDQHADTAAVGSRLIDPDGSISGSAFRFPSIGREFIRGARTPKLGRIFGVEPLMVTSEKSCPVDWVTGASFMVRRTALQECGLFDDGFFLYFEEVELMWRFRQHGWTVRHEPESRVEHVGGAATGMNELPQDRILPPPPAYWFKSRRRYFTRTLGKLGAIAATASWLVGHVVWTIRRGLGLAPGKQSVRGEAGSLIRNGLLPTRQDRTPAIPVWTSPQGQPPMWMRDPT